MKKSSLLTILIILLGISFFIEKYISLQNHTLASTKSWFSVKQVASPYRNGLMGVLNFVYDRPTLAQEQLNLGTWFGHQDVLYKEPLIEPRNFKVAFGLDTEFSYIIIYLNCNETNCLAVRLSRNQEFPNAFIEIDESGRFLFQKYLNSNINKNLNYLTVEYEKESVKLFLNNQFIDEIRSIGNINLLRFSGGYHSTSLKNVTYSDSTKTNHIIDFKVPFQLNIFLIAFFILSLFSCLIIWVNTKKEIIYRYLTMLLVSFVLIILCYNFDYYYYSKLYITDGIALNEYRVSSIILKFEELRKKAVKIFFDIESENIFLKSTIWLKSIEKFQVNQNRIVSFSGFQKYNKFVEFKNENEWDQVYKNTIKGYKLAIIGGSQAWGGGASRPELSWGAKLAEELKKVIKSDVEMVNFSICGGVIQNLNSKLKYIVEYKPNILILSFGANDVSTQSSDFQKHFNYFLKTIEENKIQLIVNIEAVETEDLNQDETKKAEIIKQMLLNKFPVLSLHHFMHKKNIRNSGLIWKDQIHFSDYGHALAAQFFLNELVDKNLINK